LIPLGTAEVGPAIPGFSCETQDILRDLLLWQLNMSNVMPDLIRHPGQLWIPAFAGMTVLTYIVAGVITYLFLIPKKIDSQQG